MVTDHAWRSLDIERRVLGAIGAELIIAQTGEESELVQLAPRADAILTNRKPITPTVLDAARSCRVVACYGFEVDNVAVQHATCLGILVTNVPHNCTEEVSDHTMGLLLMCARSIAKLSSSTRRGKWDLDAGQPLQRLRGKTLGILGFGNVAKALIPKALSFGLEIIAYTPHIPYGKMTNFGTLTNNLKFVLSESDFVSIHMSLNAETRGLINSRALRLMKPSAYLINTSHGAIIDETDLYQALKRGWIAGVALDVLGIEPPNPDNPLLRMENVIVTPHAAFCSDEVIEELERNAATQVAQVLCNQVPPNVVNPEVTRQASFRLEIEVTGAFESRVHVS